MSEKHTYIIIGTPVDLGGVDNPENYQDEDGEIQLFDGGEIEGNFGILGKKVAESRLNGRAAGIHNKDLLSSYRKYKGKVKSALDDHELIDGDVLEVSLYSNVYIG